MEPSARLPEADYEDSDERTSYGCWCFNGVCWRSRKSNGRYNLLSKEEQGINGGSRTETLEVDGTPDGSNCSTPRPSDRKIREEWFAEKLKKVKEVSEILAGPKWKNFIRRIGLNKKRRIQLQYDPQSYALNFDDGINKELDLVFPNFSARFATPIGNNLSLVEL